MATRLNRDQVLEREVEPDAEHQEDDADLGELVGDLDVGDEARAVRADDDAGDEVADQRGEAEAVGDGAEDEGEHEADDDRRDQWRPVLHCGSLCAGAANVGDGAALLQASRKDEWSEIVGARAGINQRTRIVLNSPGIGG